jgi:hypothetical protein
MGPFSHAGVCGDATAFFQPATLRRKSVLMFFFAIDPPNSLCFAAHTVAIIRHSPKAFEEKATRCLRKAMFLGGCRVKTTKSDTAGGRSLKERRVAWPQEDRIRWIEWRVRELTIKNGQYIDERGKWLLEQKAAGGRRFVLGDKIADYVVWLLKVRDGLSWHQIAYRFFPGATEDEIEKFESKVRRAYARVERSHPGSEAYVPEELFERDEILLEAVMLGVIPVCVSGGPDEPAEHEDSSALEIESGC